jgi:hypothetical protein
MRARAAGARSRSSIANWNDSTRGRARNAAVIAEYFQRPDRLTHKPRSKKLEPEIAAPPPDGVSVLIESIRIRALLPAKRISHKRRTSQK